MLAALDQKPPSRARHYHVLQAACDSHTCSVAAGIHRLPLAVSPLPPTVSPVSRHRPVNKREQTGPAEPRWSAQYGHPIMDHDAHRSTLVRRRPHLPTWAPRKWDGRILDTRLELYNKKYDRQN